MNNSQINIAPDSAAVTVVNCEQSQSSTGMQQEQQQQQQETQQNENETLLTTAAATTAAESNANESTNLNNNNKSFINNLNIKRNKSNLYLIKSYSFMDKLNDRNARIAMEKSKIAATEADLAAFRNIQALLLDATDAGAVAGGGQKLKKSQSIRSKFSFHHKLKKSKSTHDSAENINDFKQLLRKPEKIPPEKPLRVGGSSSKFLRTSTPANTTTATTINDKRPISLPTSVTHIDVEAHKSSNTNNNNSDDAHKSSAALKRDSFIRHSLQSIRRSFSWHKKFKSGGSLKSASSTTSSNVSANSSTHSQTSAASPPPASKKEKKHKSKKQKSLDEVDRAALGTATTLMSPLSVANGSSSADDESNTKDVMIMLNGVHIIAGGNGSSSSIAANGDTTLGVLREEEDDDEEQNLLGKNTATCKRSTSSVSTLAFSTPDTTSMAPLQSHNNETQSVLDLNALASETSLSQQQPTDSAAYAQQLSTSGSNQSGYSSTNSSAHEILQHTTAAAATSRNSGNKTETRNLKTGNSSQLNPLVAVSSSSSIRSLSPSRKSISSGGSTAKNEQMSNAVVVSKMPPEKEKKRKEVSSSRVKKFHRHFTQVPKDEKLINYFSCALVSDILLQGHLYITDQHFAFHSNVFGYVTKVVIPTSSVTKISKEKTAKIIPNALGVATIDERHVFSSFLSREAAFRLMCSVCPPIAPIAEILPKTPADIEISEECSIEDDSSCSISGNESSAQITDGSGQTILRRSMAASSNLSVLTEGKVVGNDKFRHSDIPQPNASYLHDKVGSRASAPPSAFTSNNNSKSAVITSVSSELADMPKMIIAGTVSSTTDSSTPTHSNSSSPTTVVATGLEQRSRTATAVQATAEACRALSKNVMLRLRFPTELHVIYVGVFLAVLLALLSVFLLYRILDIEAKASLYRSPMDMHWRARNDDELFAESLRWQKELQQKSTEEAQNILATNLEQIAKVRRSLETLSMLIHDRKSIYEPTTTTTTAATANSNGSD